MPRTKMVRRRPTVASQSNEDLRLAQEELQRRIRIMREKIEKELVKHRNQLNQEYEMILGLYSSDLHKSMGELRAEELASHKLGNCPSASQIKQQKLSSTSQKDDGYVTDGSLAQKKFKAPRRQSRSLSRNNAKTGVSTSTTSSFTPRTMRNRSSSASSLMGPPRTNKRPRYHTPANRRPGAPQYPPITPKVAPNTSMTILRRPREGEMVLSLSGSPLMVNSVNGVEDKANCNIPLADGTVLSLLPNKMRISTDLPIHQMRPETRKDLKVLQSNLTTYLEKISSKYKMY